MFTDIACLVQKAGGTTEALMSVSCRSPSVMGIFAADRSFLGEIGGLDGGMTVYGGENVELGIRVSATENVSSNKKL